VVHVLTRKGKGYDFAEKDPGIYHGVGAFSLKDGIIEENGKPKFTNAFSNALLEAARKDRRIVAVTAAMGRGTGLLPFKKEFPERCFDAGIAEEHAVTFAAGLAARGQRPVVAIYSTFMQRAVDQVIHDVCLQKLPVTFALDRSGFVSDDGETHQGLYDISIFRSAPGMTILSPAGEAELNQIINNKEQILNENGEGPMIIRFPKAACPPDDPAFHEPFVRGRGAFVRRIEGAALCLCFTGGLYPEALEAAGLLAEQGITVDLYNLRYLKPVDEAYLCGIMNSYQSVVFIEEGVRAGGFGEYAAELALREACSAKIIVMAAPEGMDLLGSRDELIARAGLDGAGISRGIRQSMRWP
jgi:1-deoxy-D-xylulose-5-phosphate synthase